MTYTTRTVWTSPITKWEDLKNKPTVFLAISVLVNQLIICFTKYLLQLKISQLLWPNFDIFISWAQSPDIYGLTEKKCQNIPVLKVLKTIIG